ncbi:MAG: ethanolamine utilization protein EutN [Fidelibacterota bacterium]|nr:MAG: ethanolamine utilization protein EutN [Candidatus Neomarinimicrobiota bacterium]
MFLGPVVGTVWATNKWTDLVGLKFLIFQPMDLENGEDVGATLVTADSQYAGEDDLVNYVTSKEASFPFERKYTALDAAVVGHGDRIDL